MQLRTYQAKVIDDLWGWFYDHSEGNCIIEACVGAGKSVMIAALCERALTQYPGTRIVMAVHVRELVEQNLDKLLQVWPGAPVGAYSASLGRREAWRDVTFCTIQTVHNKSAEFGRVDLLLVDECHLISPAAQSMYQRFIAGLRAINPALRVVGWTGTAFRGNGVWLTAQGLFSHVAARVKMADLLAQGYLAPLKAVATANTISAEGVAVRQGDYVVGELEAAADHADLVRAAAAEIVRLAHDRKSWMVFAVTVRHALHVLQAIRAHGVPAAMVTGETPMAERERYIGQFKTGQLRCLVNVAVLTTGFDVPAVDCIALLRPTKSPVLYVQIAGRGMRTADGKTDCIAEGQRVLTDRGLVPIENVTVDMLVWDGVSFVRHDGAVCKGDQDVITYAGLTATPDHRVWTERGWARFADCAAAGIGIAVGGYGRSPVREVDRHFRGCDDHQREQVFAGALHWLRRIWDAAHRQLAQANRWLSPMREPAFGPTMAAEAVRVGVSAVHQPELHELRAVRRAWHPLRVRLADSNGGLGSKELGAKSGAGDRPNRQRSGIQAGQFEAFDASAKLGAYAQTTGISAGARLQAGAPPRSLRRHDADEADCIRPDITGDNRAMDETVVQAKRRVWDLLNAGPLHRFTCEGLIVSNCLWLDFTSTTRELGPVDMIRGRAPAPKPPGARKGPSEAPVKICPECGNPSGLMALVCGACGFEYPPDLKHGAASDGAQVLGTRFAEHAITRVDYRRHAKPGKPPSLRADYWVGIRLVASEWVCLEHEGYAREKAAQWWRARGHTPTPQSVDEAIARLPELIDPLRIHTRQAGPHTEIVRHEFDRTEQRQGRPEEQAA